LFTLFIIIGMLSLAFCMFFAYILLTVANLLKDPIQYPDEMQVLIEGIDDSPLSDYLTLELEKLKKNGMKIHFSTGQDSRYRSYSFVDKKYTDLRFTISFGEPLGGWIEGYIVKEGVGYTHYFCYSQLLKKFINVQINSPLDQIQSPIYQNIIQEALSFQVKNKEINIA
jgi:hypothetical protein